MKTNSTMARPHRCDPDRGHGSAADHCQGFQTYGTDYKVDKDQMSMEIRMNRPGHQYSIYKDNKKLRKRRKQRAGQEEAASEWRRAAENSPNKDQPQK